MTREEVVELAKASGCWPSLRSGFGVGYQYAFNPEHLERLADLIKEKCATEAEKTVTMEGYEKEIARDIRAL